MIRLAIAILMFSPLAVGATEATAPTADETRAFMRKLAEYVAENHLKKDEKSPQHGMVYEYFNVARKGHPDQWIQGEALDTMHDGAFFALALATAYKATGDIYYKDLLTKWVLPFYVKVLNNSDTLFSPDKDNAGPKAHKFNKEHQLQKDEKGFCPYWWDDGASVSLEQRRSKSRDLFFSGTNNLKGKENPHAKLDGYSHGSSNHMAQDLGIMLQGCWLVLKDSKDETDRKLAEEVALAAKNLHECRMRHHGVIPAVAAAAALTNNDAELMKRVGEMKFGLPSNHYTRLLSSLDDNKRHATPGFTDDAEYRFYSQTAKSGKLADAVAFKLIYDAYTEPMLFRYWSDNAEVPPGMNRFDLSPIYGKNGKFESYRSDRPVGMGSRMGPQTMVVSAWGLQALKAKPGLWDEAVKKIAGKDRIVFMAPLKPEKNVKIDRIELGRYPSEVADGTQNVVIASREADVKKALERELASGLRTWMKIFTDKGYIPTGIGAGKDWDGLSDTGGYAHLIKAGALYLMWLEGKKDFEN